MWVGIAWFAIWLIVTVIGCIRLLMFRAVQQSQRFGVTPSAHATIQRRVAIGAAVFVLLIGSMLSAASIQRLVTRPTIIDAAIVVVSVPVLLLSARQLLFKL